MPKRKKQEQFIKEAIEKHGEKYTYDKVIYINNKTKVKIYCNKCDDYFEQLPMIHIRGNGCLKCVNKNQTKTNKQFIKESNKIHNNKYIYIDDYINAHTKIKIECPEHGIFKQLPLSHLSGNGCPKCVGYTTDIFINKSKNVHHNKYDYSLVKYINSLNKVKIICSEHGIFKQLPLSHLSGNGCPKCYGIRTTNDFIKKANKIHNNKYTYINISIYKSSHTKIKIECPEHGVFEQMPYAHIQGQGCPRCTKITNKNDFIVKANKIHNNKYNYAILKYCDLF